MGRASALPQLCLSSDNPALLPCVPPAQVRQESGVNSFADVAKLLEGAPKPLLDTLRLGAVVRHSGEKGAHAWAVWRWPLPDMLRLGAVARRSGAQGG